MIGMAIRYKALHGIASGTKKVANRAISSVQIALPVRESEGRREAGVTTVVISRELTCERADGNMCSGHAPSCVLMQIPTS